MNSLNFSRGRTLTVAVLVAFLFMIGIFASDIYVPALPVMSQSLQASQMEMELSVALYFLSFALSQLVYGPFAEHFGRKAMIMLGLLIGLLGSVMCMQATSGEMLIFGRIIQGAGMGAPMSLGRVVLRDLFTNVELARWNSYTGAIALLAPSLAPIIGGYLAYEVDWTAIFVFLVIFLALMLTATGFLLPETRGLHQETLVMDFKSVMKSYKKIIINKGFWRYASTAALALGGMVAYLTLSAFLFQVKLGFTIIEYSWISVFVSVALIGGMLGNIWLLYYFKYDSLIKCGLILKCISGLFLVVMLSFGIFNAFCLVLTITLFSFACSLVFANASSGAFTNFTSHLGLVGALYGATQMFVSGAVGTIVSFSQNYADWALGITFLLLGLIGLYYFGHLKENTERGEL